MEYHFLFQFRLSLQRHLWLSFDGSTLTQSDRLTGEISRATRLSMGAPTHLGRVAIDGQDQLITQDADGVAGIEIKRGPLQLSADSELRDAPRRFPASGWQHDVDKLGVTLELPPGWRLLHAAGVDQAQGAWLTQWDLLDLFFVLLIALAARQLWGLPGVCWRCWRWCSPIRKPARRPGNGCSCWRRWRFIAYCR